LTIYTVWMKSLLMRNSLGSFFLRRIAFMYRRHGGNFDKTLYQPMQDGWMDFKEGYY